MYIITLVGHREKGKTAAIKMLVEEMLENGFLLVDDYKKMRQRSCVDARKLQKCNGDFLTYKGDITIKLERDGKTIGITSFGDDVNEIRTKFNLFKNCDLFLSAAHPDDDTMKYIESIAKNNSHIVIGKSTVNLKRLPPNKTPATVEKKCNESVAKEMLEIINYLIRKN